MSNGNFTHGALVFRVWRFDGTTELLAKTQYMLDAELFARARLSDDETREANKEDRYFYLVVCEHDCVCRAFQRKSGEAV